MNDPEAMRQLQAMVSFIKQEAEEKARELMVEAEEEFNIAKLQTLEAEKSKLKKEFDRKLQQLEAKKRIERSKQVNQMRLKVLTARQEILDAVTEDCRAEISSLVADPSRYKDLLVKLICQSMEHLGGHHFLVRVRKCDVTLAQSCLEPARTLYQQKTGASAPGIDLDREHYLPPAPGSVDDPDVATCLGGVAVTSDDGKVVSSNTLDDRLRITLEDNLPGIRTHLFGTG